MVDIGAFFDKFPPERAADATFYAGFPWEVRMAFAGYSFHRHLRVGNVFGGAIAPAAGIVAGDTVSMYVEAAFMAVGLTGGFPGAPGGAPDGHRAGTWTIGRSRCLGR